MKLFIWLTWWIFFLEAVGSLDLLDAIIRYTFNIETKELKDFPECGIITVEEEKDDTQGDKYTPVRIEENRGQLNLQNFWNQFCSSSNPCGYGRGDCNENGAGGDCLGSLVCGSNNCRRINQDLQDYPHWVDCCVYERELYSQSCSADYPCPLGQGDCDSGGDGDDCEGSLVCGTDNCRDFSSAAASWTDCCKYPGVEDEQRPCPNDFTTNLTITSPNYNCNANANSNYTIYERRKWTISSTAGVPGLTT